MQLRKSEKKQAKIRLAIQGSSGSGKTMSSLKLAYGITNDWSKIAIIDSESGSADLYASLGSYLVLPLEPPYSPERYIQAIEVCEAAPNIEVIIIDSISHCWDFLLQYHSGLQGNSFTNWSKVTPRQNLFIQKLLQCKHHVIATMRTKQDYVLNLKNGKHVPEKVGLKSIQRDGVDYEFTTVFDLDLQHHCKASKDRTSLFMDKPEFIITEETGKQILEWTMQGTTLEEVKKLINTCTSIEQLNDLYRKYPDFYTQLEQDFKQKKESFLIKSITTKTTTSNGTTNHE